jgi:hypothetical protein
VTGFSVPATSSSLTVSITTFTATDNVGVTGYLINESATKPTAAAAGWSATPPASYPFTTAGTKTLFAWAKDAAGNVSNGLSAPVIITVTDAIPPTVTGFSVPATSSALTVSITIFTATDNVGVTGYLINESATNPGAAAAGWSATPPASYSFTTAGTKTLFAWAKDAAGNVSNSSSAPVIITVTDAIPPTVTGFSAPATSSSLTVSITTFTATDNVGVTGYLITESATNPGAAAAGWSATPPASYAFTTAGNKTLFAWAKDTAGNVSNGLSAPVTITLTGSANVPSIVGIYRNGSWLWDKNGNGIWEGCTVDDCGQPFGGYPGDVPVAGDWTGDGLAKIGIYRQGQWYLDKNGNGAWDDCAIDTCVEAFGGLAGDIPVAGDWTGDGLAKIGIYRQGQWYLDKNGNGAWDGCEVDICLPAFGGYPGDVPVAGDWTGDGLAKIGIYRQGQWYLDKNGNGAWDGCAIDTCYDSFGGLPIDKPVVGDWTGDGITKVGIYQNGAWYLDKNGNGSWSDREVDLSIQAFGGSGEDIPLAK